MGKVLLSWRYRNSLNWGYRCPGAELSTEVRPTLRNLHIWGRKETDSKMLCIGVTNA